MLVRHAILAALPALSLVAALSVPPARAGGPSPVLSTAPKSICVAGSSASAPDSVTAKFAVFVRTHGGSPYAASNVVIDLSGCPDIRVASDPLNPNARVNCALRQVSAYTNAQGEVDFALVGNSWNAGTYSGAGCARIYADGILLSTPVVAAFDLDGANGVNAADFSILLGDLGSGSYRQRSDYDGSGTLSGADISLWLGALARGGSTTSGSTCP